MTIDSHERARVDALMKKAEALAFTLAYGIATSVIAISVHLTWSPFAGDHGYHFGSLLGIGTSFVLGSLFSLPWSYGKRGLSLALASIGFMITASASHYHAVFNRLPSWRALEQLTEGGVGASVSANAPTMVLALEVIFGVIFVALATRRVAPLLEERARPIGIAMIVFAVAGLAAWGLGEGTFATGASDRALALLRPPPALPALPTAPTVVDADATVADEAPPTPTVPAQAVELVRSKMGMDGSALNATHPLCRETLPSASVPLAPRSVILLILESVSNREMALEPMVNLRRIASDGVSFSRFSAAGDRSSQALVGIFSSIPAETHRRILKHAPLADLAGMAAEFGGHERAYFHGSDLSFEQQRAYLRSAGYRADEIIEPEIATDTRLGWGTPDGVMFDRVQRFMEARERAAFATFFTISSHDPFVLPEDEGQASGSRFERFTASLAYLDRELGEFYDWYLANERDKGTLLVITGDHAPPLPHDGDPAETSTGELEYRFRVPFIVVGSEREASEAITQRTAGHLDIAPTIYAELGRSEQANRSGTCHAGRDLFAEDFPDDRWVVSMAGEQLEWMFVHNGATRWGGHLGRRQLTAFDVERDPLFRSALPMPPPADLQNFVPAYLMFNGHMNQFNAYFATPSTPTREAVEQLTPQRRISHRGNAFNGPSRADDDPPENTIAGVLRAVERGFEWVEVDLQVTRDGVVVLAHDAEVTTPEGDRVIAEHALSALRATGASVESLDDLITQLNNRAGLLLELKPQRNVFRHMDLVEGVIKALPRIERAMVDSFNREMIRSVAAHSDVETAYDLPQRPVQMEWLDFAASAEFDWVFIRKDFATPEAAAAARSRGVRVMAYTVNETALTHVDGIISDRSSFE